MRDPQTVLDHTPPVGWRQFVDGALLNDSAADVEAFRAEVRARAILYARFAGYVDTYVIVGQSDHAKAVDASNRAVRAVAKALGYSYPAAHEISF